MGNRWNVHFAQQCKYVHDNKTLIYKGKIDYTQFQIINRPYRNNGSPRIYTTSDSFYFNLILSLANKINLRHDKTIKFNLK